MLLCGTTSPIAMEEVETFPTWLHIDLSRHQAKVDKMFSVLHSSYPQLSPTPYPHISLSPTHLLSFTQAQAFASSLLPRLSSLPSFRVLLQTDPGSFRLLTSPKTGLVYGVLVLGTGQEEVRAVLGRADEVAQGFGLETYLPTGTPHMSLGVSEGKGQLAADMDNWPVKSLSVTVTSLTLSIGKKTHSFPLTPL